MTENMKTFFSDFFSVEEWKFSILGFTLIITLICAMVFLFMYRNIPDNILTLLGWEIAGFGGVSVFNLFKK